MSVELRPMQRTTRSGSSPGGVPSAQHSVYVIEADGEPAGDLWLSERDETLEPCLFVYDVYLDERYRGPGGPQPVPVAGYEENAVSMSKKL